jgi:hypothetical protein
MQTYGSDAMSIYYIILKHFLPAKAMSHNQKSISMEAIASWLLGSSQKSQSHVDKTTYPSGIL